MPGVPADAFITCRVTSETKALVRALATREGINESAFVKRLLHDALRASPLGDRMCRTLPPRITRQQRVNVRLAPEHRRLLDERAAARGVAVATYVALLVRTHVSGRASLPRSEYLLLRECVAELAAIGRNLNQIAKAINSGGRVAPPGAGEVAAMRKAADALRDQIKELLKANESSWSSRGETTH
jgi:predicted DNA binding CopG/RHH family protein